MKIQQSKSSEERKLLKQRKNLIREFIREIQQKQERRRIEEIANKIKKDGGFDANAFWKHAEMTRGRKAEPATAMKREDGQIEEDPEEIKEIYLKFYEKLLKDREPEDAEEKRIQLYKEKCINLMDKEANRRKIQPITDTEYAEMKRKLKKKKAPDRQGWRYEYVQWAGNDLERSIKLMINEIIGTKLQPNEWHQMTIKSISKNLRKKMEMQYKRGLFLSNIISKCTERIFLNRR